MDDWFIGEESAKDLAGEMRRRHCEPSNENLWHAISSCWEMKVVAFETTLVVAIVELGLVSSVLQYNDEALHHNGIFL
jgi:hypothetical protein